MAVPFETIKPEFVRLWNFIVGDLDYLVDHETGGNYLAAALITCACDTLSYLRYDENSNGGRFFAEVLPTQWAALADKLYQAIRDGIVHSYDTKVICVGSQKITVNISWSEKPHFHLSPDRTTLHINIRNLAADFKNALKRFEADLMDNPDLRKTFESRMRKSRELVVRGSDRKVWEQCLSTMQIAI